MILTKIVFFISPLLAVRAPGLWKIYGSNDGITWDYLPNASNITTRVTESNYSTGSYTQTVANSGISYLYYGLVVNQIAGNNYYLDFGEWQLFGVEKISCQADWNSTIINKPDLTLYATTTNLNGLSTNSILSINNLNTTSTTLLGLVNSHTTSISNLNTTSTTIFTNLNSLSTNSILSISNLNTTSTTLFTSLSNKQDIYTAQRQYPSRVFDSSTSETTTTFLGKTVYTASFTLNNNGSTYDYGTYTCYYNSNYGNPLNTYNVINNNTTDRGVWAEIIMQVMGFIQGLLLTILFLIILVIGLLLN